MLMASAGTSRELVDSAPLPPYLARHTHLGFNADDVTALLSSIDSSQNAQPTSAPQLPAELLLQVLEHVPVDYVLDWRLICRGFRDAIDGRILFHLLRRTELIGYLGPKRSQPLDLLDDETYDKVHLMRAHFQRFEESDKDTPDAKLSGPLWSAPYAVFQIEDEWFQSLRHIDGFPAQDGVTFEHVHPRWVDIVGRLQLQVEEEGFGTLRWCIKLDHGVLDMDFPVEVGRNTFHVDVCLRERRMIVEWKAMLFSFLKTETALRRSMEIKHDSEFTFSHAEDCLRDIRRRRLHSTLDHKVKVDRHIKWCLRLLIPLWGKPYQNRGCTLDDVETDAIDILLLLRREAALTAQQQAFLRQLTLDYAAMQADISTLDQAFREFKTHFGRSGFPRIFSPTQPLPRNPIAWSDELCVRVKEQVTKWKAQSKVIEQMKTLLIASNMALTVHEDSFEDLGSQI